MKLLFRHTLRIIEHANDMQIQLILKAILRRYHTYYPDHEVLFLSLHKETNQRQKDVEEIIRFLQKHP